jgi:hypothetical protein
LFCCQLNRTHKSDGCTYSLPPIHNKYTQGCKF